MLPAQLLSNTLAVLLLTPIFCISEIDFLDNIYPQMKSVAGQQNVNSMDIPLSISACENKKLKVKCEKGKVIYVLQSNYGRTSLDVCNPDNNKEWSVDCRSENSEYHVFKQCHGRQNCEVPAKNLLLGDSCPGTIKYLEVKYLCEVRGNKNFQCPSFFGNYLHETDCKLYYSCKLHIPHLWPCPYSKLFDEVSGQCKPAEEVDCGSRKRPGYESTLSPIAVESTSEGYQPTTSPKTASTPEGDDKFRCPDIFGNFMHPTDCTKYYTCQFFKASVRTCPNSKLFEGIKRRCKPANEVHCGSRTRPTDSTIIAETTTELTNPTTTVQPTTTTMTPTVIVITTSTKPRVTVPGTDCDEEDLDCIIKDLGQNPDGFECEADMGSYPHPASKKLFIFCMNWKPSVKKCGKDLVFSKQQRTCVSDKNI